MPTKYLFRMDHPRTVVDLFCSFLKNGPSSTYFPFIFGPFKTNNTNFTRNKSQKCPSSIKWRDLNPRPSEHESPPITTRPGLPAIKF